MRSIFLFLMVSFFLLFYSLLHLMYIHILLYIQLTATSERDEKHSETNESLQAQLSEQTLRVEKVEKELSDKVGELESQESRLLELESKSKADYHDLEMKLQKSLSELKEANKVIEEFSANNDSSARESANTALQLAKQQRESEAQLKSLQEEVPFFLFSFFSFFFFKHICLFRCCRDQC
jgi:multidrug resistance efflux pump